MIWRLRFWKRTIEISIASVAESAVAIISAAGLGILDVDWIAVASVAGLAGVVAILKAVGASVVGDKGTPYIVRDHNPIGIDEDDDDADPRHDQPIRSA